MTAHQTHPNTAPCLPRNLSIQVKQLRSPAPATKSDHQVRKRAQHLDESAIMKQAHPSPAKVMCLPPKTANHEDNSLHEGREKQASGNLEPC